MAITKTMLVGAATAVALAAAPATAGFGDVLASFRAPAPGPTALTWAGGYLYCYCNTPPYRIWKVNPANGNVVGSYSYWFTGANTAGLTFDGVYFWVADAETDYFYRYTTAGSVVSSFKASWNVGRAITWAGVHIWGFQHVGTFNDVARQMRVDGSVISTFSYFYELYGAGWDGRYLWVNDYDSFMADYHVVALSEGGSNVASFGPPADEPRSIAYDGTYIWLGTLPDNGRLWKLDTRAVAVRPVSFGRLKALYR